MYTMEMWIPTPPQKSNESAKKGAAPKQLKGSQPQTAVGKTKKPVVKKDMDVIMTQDEYQAMVAAIPSHTKKGDLGFPRLGW